MNPTKTYNHIILFVLIIFITSCFGPRLNKNTYESKKTIANVISSNKDENIIVNLEFILVRNSLNSWVKDANWDEYIFQITNNSNSILNINKISITDSMNIKSNPETTRKKLNKATKKVVKRFKNSGVKIKLGNGSTGLLATSITTAALGVGLGAGAASGGGLAISAGTLTTAGGAVIVALPVSIIGGIIKVVNNTKVNNKIQERQTLLPISINSRINSYLDIFYPATPAPKSIGIEYTINEQSFTLVLTLPDSLRKLHHKNL